MINGTGPKPEIEENDCLPCSTAPPDEDAEEDEPSGRNQISNPTAIHQRRLANDKVTMSFRGRFMANPTWLRLTISMQTVYHHGTAYAFPRSESPSLVTAGISSLCKTGSERNGKPGIWGSVFTCCILQPYITTCLQGGVKVPTGGESPRAS
jgi:hypothetical protein